MADEKKAMKNSDHAALRGRKTSNQSQDAGLGTWEKLTLILITVGFTACKTNPLYAWGSAITQRQLHAQHR